jgi:hypothetical protein
MDALHYQAQSKGFFRIRYVVFISDMNIVDEDLHVINYFNYNTLEEIGDAFKNE